MYIMYVCMYVCIRGSFALRKMDDGWMDGWGSDRVWIYLCNLCVALCMDLGWKSNLGGYYFLIFFLLSFSKHRNVMCHPWLRFIASLRSMVDFIHLPSLLPLPATNFPPAVTSLAD